MYGKYMAWINVYNMGVSKKNRTIVENRLA